MFVYLVLFQLVLLLYPRENLSHVGLQHHAAHDQLVEDEMHFVHVEDQVQLADVFEAFVERLHEDLNEVEDAEFGLGRVDAEDKVERRVVSVDELEVVGVGAADDGAAALEEVAHVVFALRDELKRLLDDLLLLGFALK